MKTAITTADVLSILNRIAEEMVRSMDYLTQLDAAMGDGDLGITMTLGFGAIKNELAAWSSDDVGTILSKAGVVFGNKAPSTFGALLATAFMRAGRSVKGKTDLDLADVVVAAQAAELGIRERGKAVPGDKTMLDAIVPAVHALAAHQAQGSTLIAALEDALLAAEKGMKATVGMKAASGRGAWLGERTIDHQDPGATACFLMLKVAVEYLRQSN